MNRAELVNLIITTLNDLLEPEEQANVAIDEETRLFGKTGLLDSLRLVGLVLDTEQYINDEVGTMIALADDRAMSQERSPFRTIGSLADYAHMLIQEEQEAVR